MLGGQCPDSWFKTSFPTTPTASTLPHIRSYRDTVMADEPWSYWPLGPGDSEATVRGQVMKPDERATEVSFVAMDRSGRSGER